MPQRPSAPLPYLRAVSHGPGKADPAPAARWGTAERVSPDYLQAALEVSAERARWFAKRFAEWVSDPQVYRLEVPERAVLAYSNQRKEQEFIVEVPTRLRPERCA